MIDLLVKNGFILTLDPAGTTHEPGALAIDSGRILAIGPWPGSSSTREWLRI